MSLFIRKIAPQEIEAESFRIISAEIGEHGLDHPTFKVVQRVIHATGDFSFLDNMRFHPQAIATGLAALRAGRDVLTDVNMAATGISKKLLGRCGSTVSSGVADEEVARLARQQGQTRSEVAIEQGLSRGVGIVAIGNAPTALLKTIDCLAEMEPDRRPLVIGVPVGFVNAAESKELLARQDFPFITSLGRKGGSPVAAAIVNALLHLVMAEK